MILILAGDYHQARILAEILGVSPLVWLNVQSIEDLRGRDRRTTMLIWGTAHRRSAYREIIDYAVAAQFYVLSIKDERGLMQVD